MRKYIYTVVASAASLLVFFWFFGAGVVEYPSSHWQNALDPQSHASVLTPAGAEHPVLQLVQKAEREFEALQARQSKSLEEAIREYRRRYGMHPPPRFDKWYEFAIERGTALIDEYDEIYDSLFLFWALRPEVIRARAREVLGEDVALMGVSIRDGVARTVGEGFSDYQNWATYEMIASFAAHLPDMDLAFNVNDEPRIVIPHEDIVRMTRTAHESIQTSVKWRDAQNIRFTRPDDLNDGTSYQSLGTSRFNRLAHQNTWAHSRMSCSPDSPARTLDGNETDYDTRFAFGDLRFISNITLFSDICLVPSVQEFIGLFNHPNAFDLAHELVPIFSPSKLSTFQDILYPSSYYYSEKAVYDDYFDVEWENKTAKLYWRGSTTGGHSDDGNWRKLLRQSVVTKLNSPGNIKILERDASGSWTETELSGHLYSELFDAHFTNFMQCDAHVCDEMREFFGTFDRATQEDAWNHRYLLDMDGNALSGRFHAFLKSQSLPFKLAYFREWHFQRVMPWKHYVPVSADTKEYTEIIRFLEYDAHGQKIAKQMASDGRDWANQVVRKQDLEVYMFRLLLEYGRLVDDNRDHLG